VYVQVQCNPFSMICAAVSATFLCASSRSSVHATRRAKWPRRRVAHASATRCSSSSVPRSASAVSVASAPTSASPRTSAVRRSATAAFTGSARHVPCARRHVRQVRWARPTWLEAIRSWNVPEMTATFVIDDDTIAAYDFYFTAASYKLQLHT